MKWKKLIANTKWTRCSLTICFQMIKNRRIYLVWISHCWMQWKTETRRKMIYIDIILIIWFEITLINKDIKSKEYEIQYLQSSHWSLKNHRCRWWQEIVNNLISAFLSSKRECAKKLMPNASVTNTKVMSSKSLVVTTKMVSPWDKESWLM